MTKTQYHYLRKYRKRTAWKWNDMNTIPYHEKEARLFHCRTYDHLDTFIPLKGWYQHNAVKRIVGPRHPLP